MIDTISISSIKYYRRLWYTTKILNSSDMVSSKLFYSKTFTITWTSFLSTGHKLSRCSTVEHSSLHCKQFSVRQRTAASVLSKQFLRTEWIVQKKNKNKKIKKNRHSPKEKNDNFSMNVHYLKKIYLFLKKSKPWQCGNVNVAVLIKVIFRQ